MIRHSSSGGVVVEPGQFGIVSYHGVSGLYRTPKRFLNGPKKNRYDY